MCHYCQYYGKSEECICTPVVLPVLTQEEIILNKEKQEIKMLFSILHEDYD
jgi:hypothetical protein